MSMIGDIGVFAAVVLLFVIIQKLSHWYARKNDYKQMAIVVEFRREKIKSMRNNFTKVDYPYVKMKKGDTTKLHCLRNASSYRRYYEVGEEVAVFWHDGKLLAW